MAQKNNKKNRRRATFYGISKFDYEMREKLAAGQPLPKETSVEEKVVESSPEDVWTEDWILKITVIQTTSRKA